MQRREEIRFLLTPGFSQVPDAGKAEKPFQRFLCVGSKPLKRFVQFSAKFTRLKPGVNEIPCESWRLCAFALKNK